MQAVQEQLAQTAENLAESWMNDFCSAYIAKAAELSLQLECTNQVVQDIYSYATWCYEFWSGRRQDRPYTVSLHPVFKALAEHKAAERWQVDQLSKGKMPALTKKKLAPVEIDRMRPTILNPRHNYLLNFDPDQYFGRRVKLRPPSTWNCCQFMERYLPGWGLGQVTSKLRVLTNGRVAVKSRAKDWFLMFGIYLNFDYPDAPTRVINTVSPELVKDNRLEMFLEELG